MATIGPFDFSQGLNTTASIQITPMKQAYTLTGWRPDYNSIKTQNNTYTVCGTISSASKYVLGLAYWEDPASNLNSGKIIVAVHNSKVWRMQFQESGAVGTFTDCTGTATVSDGINISYQLDYLNGILFGVGGSVNADPPFKLSSSGGNCANLGGTPPKGECCKVVNNFAFIAGDQTSSTTKSKLSWSNASDPETWAAGSSLAVNGGDGDSIIALGSIGTDLYIFKKHSIWRLSTVTTSVSGAVTLGPLTKVADNIGAATKFCVDNFPDGSICFLGSDLALYRLDGANSPIKLSDNPPPAASVKDILKFCAIGAFGGGTNIYMGVGIRVYPTRNSVLIAGLTGANLMYDYTQHLWWQLIADPTNPTLQFCTMAISGLTRPDTSTGNPFSLIYGTGVGTVKILESSNSLSAFPNDSDVIVTVPLSPDQSKFVPRSVIICCDLGSYFKVAFQWDGLVTTGYIFGPITSTRTKYVIPIPMREQVSGIPYASLNIRITSNNSGTATIYPIWVSDEVLS